MAKSNLGALAKLYNPAPVDDSIIPTATNQWVGQATWAAISTSLLYKVSLSQTHPNRIGKDK